MGKKSTKTNLIPIYLRDDWLLNNLYMGIALSEHSNMIKADLKSYSEDVMAIFDLEKVNKIQNAIKFIDALNDMRNENITEKIISRPDFTQNLKKKSSHYL